MAAPPSATVRYPGAAAITQAHELLPPVMGPDGPSVFISGLTGSVVVHYGRPTASFLGNHA